MQQIHCRLALRTKPDGASSVGLVWSLAFGLLKQLHFVYLSLAQLWWINISGGWRFTRQAANSSNPPSEATADLPSPQPPLKFSPNDRRASSCLLMMPFFSPFFRFFILTLPEITELLRRWCMGGCWSGQMGKCNYRCLRAWARDWGMVVWGVEEGCHKGEFRKRRHRHSSCETIAGEKIKSRILFIYLFYIKRFPFELCFLCSTTEWWVFLSLSWNKLCNGVPVCVCVVILGQVLCPCLLLSIK